MKKLIILFIILTLLLSGCVFDLDNWVTPDDAEFIALVQELDTPEKICNYMQNNFIPKAHLFYSLSPYELYKTKKGDCGDTATFAQFVANYHGYTTYKIVITITPILKHTLAVYEEEKGYTFSSFGAYFDYETLQDTFMDIVNLYYNYKTWSKYIVYNYDMNIVEQVTK